MDALARVWQQNLLYVPDILKQSHSYKEVEIIPTSE